MANCKECKEKDQIPQQSKDELAFAFMERMVKRLWILVIIAWVVVIFVVGIFTYERLQYDYTGTYEEIVVEQDAQDGGNANYIGNDGDIVNGLPESDSTETNENP